MPLIITVVPEYKRVVHLRFGRLIGIKGPGIVFPILPVIDQAMEVDLREIYLDVPPQTSITKDNAPVSIDMLIYMRVVKPEDAVLKVADVSGAARGIATTTLRAVIGDIALDDVLAKRDQINQTMQAKLDEVTDRWGVKVTAVEIREIEPPRDIQDAMSRQMSAERTRRAAVLEADGQREAAIKVAEGEKEAAILRAEGERQSAILAADGEKQAQVLEAEGLATALTKITEAARNVDDNTMGLQYLDMLKNLADSESSKWVLPVELTKFAEKFGGGK